MTGKAKVGKTFPGICGYAFREDKQAKVLAVEGVREDSAAHMAQDFDYQRGAHPALGNAVLHVALSLPAEDEVGRSAEELSNLLRDLGKAYVKEMGFESTQWALLQHFDRPHPHAHLIVNRVNNTGEVIADNFIGQQSRRVCQQIEQAFNEQLEPELKLTVAEQRGRDQARGEELTRRQQAAETPRQHRTANWQRARHEVANAVGPVSHFVGGWAELQQQVAPKGILVIPSMHQGKDQQWRPGVVFEKDGFRFKGGEVGPEFRAESLLQRFANYREQAATLAQQATQAQQGYASDAYAKLFEQQAMAANRPHETAQAPAAPSREIAPSVPPQQQSRDVEYEH
jgi:hypothetical protein